jgi:beta-xylosidase
MRIYEVTQQDPILSNARMTEVIAHYMGKSTVELIQVNSPYTPSSPYKQYKGIYDRIAQAVAPLVQVQNPDITAIIKAVNKQLPIVNLPDSVQAQVAMVQKRDREQDLAHKNYKPSGDIKTSNGFTIPDEAPDPAWKLSAK